MDVKIFEMAGSLLMGVVAYLLTSGFGKRIIYSQDGRKAGFHIDKRALLVYYYFGVLCPFVIIVFISYLVLTLLFLHTTGPPWLLFITSGAIIGNIAFNYEIRNIIIDSRK